MASGASACAACKYQRRRCTAECQLAEYFPADQPRLFRNAHRLFGVSNILKTLARVAPERRRDAMRTIIIEANAWETYPSRGCMHFILTLQHHIRDVELQLQQANQSIEAYRDVLGTLPDDDSLLLQAPQTWTPMQLAQDDMNMMDGAATATAAAASVVPEPGVEHRGHQDHIEPDDVSCFFVDNIEEEMPLPPPPPESR